MTATFTNSATDLEGLGETMKYAAPVMRAAGISLEETAAAAAILGDTGIEASMAGTSLAQAMTQLTSPKGAYAEHMEELRLNSLQAEGEMETIDQNGRGL